MRKIGRNDPPNWAETTQDRIDPGRNDPGRNDPGPKRLRAETTLGRNDQLPFTGILRNAEICPGFPPPQAALVIATSREKGLWVE